MSRPFAVRRRTERFSTLVFSCFLAGILIPGCGDDGPTGTEGEGATRLALTSHPSDAAAGETITPAVEVEVRDESGDPVTASTASVSVALASNSGGATLRGATTVTASGGVATFDELRIESAATGYTLRATASGLDPDVSAPFQITAAAPTRLGFLTVRVHPRRVVQGGRRRSPRTRASLQARDHGFRRRHQRIGVRVGDLFSFPSSVVTPQSIASFSPPLPHAHPTTSRRARASEPKRRWSAAAPQRRKPIS